jgi:hypothetical protein
MASPDEIIEEVIELIRAGILSLDQLDRLYQLVGEQRTEERSRILRELQNQTKFRMEEHSGGYAILDTETRSTRWTGDGVDMFFTDDGEALSPGTWEFDLAFHYMLLDEGHIEEAYDFYPLCSRCNEEEMTYCSKCGHWYCIECDGDECPWGCEIDPEPIYRYNPSPDEIMVQAIELIKAGYISRNEFIRKLTEHSDFKDDRVAEYVGERWEGFWEDILRLRPSLVRPSPQAFSACDRRPPGVLINTHPEEILEYFRSEWEDDDLRDIEEVLNDERIRNFLNVARSEGYNWIYVISQPFY